MLNTIPTWSDELMPRRKQVAPALPAFSLELYADTKEAAHLLGIERRSASALANTGRIPALKLGRDWFLLRDALRAYLETKAPTGKKPHAAPKMKRGE